MTTVAAPRLAAPPDFLAAGGRWPKAPRARVAVLRRLVYGFVFVDVLLTTSWVAAHRNTPGALYHPLLIGRVLHLPTPTAAFVTAVEVSLLAAAALALTGRLPRAAGVAVFLLYLEWMVIAMSYGKVDHDRFAFLVALAVLPTVGGARARDTAVDEAAGFAIACIQVAVVVTYFFAAWAKLRYGGLGWVDSATFQRAVVRRTTIFSRPLLGHPGVLHAAQYGLMLFELLSPAMLLRGRIGQAFFAMALAMHLVTYTSIGIIFLPHVVCLAAFLPLERRFARSAPAS